MKKLSLIIVLSLSILSCSIKIDAINYGSDACDFCSMTIVDKSHASQLVTEKGKNYKFDAAECLIHYLHEENNEDKMAHILVANYLAPGEMMDVKNATFVISPNIPSPMGAYLSAVENKKFAQDLINENEGISYTWETIKIQFSGNSLPHHH